MGVHSLIVLRIMNKNKVNTGVLKNVKYKS